MRARVRKSAGFGMIELVCAMSVMSVGIMAVFAMFHSGLVQIRHASNVSTAAALAESEIEKYRAVQFDNIGLVDSAVSSADATYKADVAYKADSVTTTLNGSITASQTTLTVTSASGFPTSPPFRVKIDSEIMLVTAVSGTTWTLDSGTASSRVPVDATTAAAHNSGATVTLKRLVGLPVCANPAVLPCSSSTPTQTPVGADGHQYRLDTYMSWETTATAGGSTGRQTKLVTVVVRDAVKTSVVLARVAATFDLSTGLSAATTT
jgi:uncharacterized protein (TIGR02598 family)